MAGGFLRHGQGDDFAAEESHEINVTPFIDVMLVLLIIFMVAAPLATVDTPVDLPGSTAAPQQRPDKPIWLSVSADRTLTLGEEKVMPGAMKAALDKASGGDPEKRVFLRADKGLSYGDLAEVLNRLRDAGYLKIALVGLEQTGDAPAGAAP